MTDARRAVMTATGHTKDSLDRCVSPNEGVLSPIDHVSKSKNNNKTFDISRRMCRRVRHERAGHVQARDRRAAWPRVCSQRHLTGAPQDIARLDRGSAVRGRSGPVPREVLMKSTTVRSSSVLTVFFAALMASTAFAQAPLPTPALPPPPLSQPPAQAAALPGPPSYPPAELDRIVSPIALYPDPLLAQVLAAASFSADIPDAERWAEDHHYLTGAVRRGDRRRSTAGSERAGVLPFLGARYDGVRDTVTQELATRFWPS